MNIRKVRKIIFIVIILVLVIITIFKLIGKTGRNDVTLYFFNTDGSSLLAKEQELDADKDTYYEDVAKALIKGPSSKKYSPIMDKAITLKSINKAGDRLTVDFSSEYKDENCLTTYAVIKTFCTLPGINKVLVTANGKDVLGEGFISGDVINLESDEDCATTVTLYFLDEDSAKLVKEFRKINITDTRPVEEYIMAELIKGPKADENERLLSEDTGVTSVEVTDGTCYVNFRKDFESYSTLDKDKQKLMIYSIVDSMTERDGIKNVQFLIDGKKADKLGNIDISGTLFRNENLIK